MRRWLFASFATLMILGYTACERHEWSETRETLYKKKAHESAQQGKAHDTSAKP